MPKTFNEIISRFDADHAYDGDNVIEALKAVREAVGGDPSEWWVECNGERLYIGDAVTTESTADIVQGFKICSGKVVVILKHNGTYWPENLRKSFSERENFIGDLLGWLYRDNSLTEEDDLKKVAEQFIDRAMKLGAER